MGSMTFNGTTTIIDADNVGGLGAKTAGSWSACVWAKWATAGEGSLGNFFFADTNALIFRLHTASNVIRVRQADTSTDKEIITSAPSFATGVWYCLIATYDDPGARCHLYHGTETDRMQEATYSTDTTAAGSFTAWGTRVYVGNNSAGTGTFDGQLMHAAVVDWVMDRNEMDRYRQGDLPVLFARGNPRLYFTFQDGNALIDSSRRNQPVTSTVNPAASSDQPRGVQFSWDWARGQRRAVV